jgi:hypothetical protein
VPAPTSPTRPPRGLLAGGAGGNSLLSTATGALLLVLLAALGATIVAIHSLIDEHLFIGMLLLGPLALKLASVGYRFARLYARDARYRDRGAPDVVLGTLAPLLVFKHADRVRERRRPAPRRPR